MVDLLVKVDGDVANVIHNLVDFVDVFLPLLNYVVHILHLVEDF